MQAPASTASRLQLCFGLLEELAATEELPPELRASAAVLARHARPIGAAVGLAQSSEKEQKTLESQVCLSKLVCRR